MSRALRLAAKGVPLLLLAILGACNGGSSTVTVHPTERFQVMQGWEALVGGTPECNQTAWKLARDSVLDLATLDLGLNRIRLPLRSGAEDSTDHFSRYMRGEITFDQWKFTWFRPVNDDADARHARAGGFQWSFLDHIVETQVLPMKRRIEGRGDSLWLNLVYVGGRNTPHGDDPEEYAELVEQAFVHLRDRWGLVPRSLEVINEPNMRQAWSPEQVGRGLVAAKARLAASGFAPRFYAPTTSTMQAALTYLDGMLPLPGVREALTDVSYHRYGGNREVLERIQARAESLGFRTAMSERMGANQDTLFQDLTVGDVSSWQQFALVHCPPPGQGDGGGIYVRFSQEDSLHPTVRLTPMSRLLRQYFRYVRLGAQRIGVVSDARGVQATAFSNPDGRLVVVVQATEPRAIDVRGLPAGRYGMSATTTAATASAGEIAARDTTIAAGGTVRATLPGAGVLTVYGHE